jgi:hypothetical protein
VTMSEGPLGDRESNRVVAIPGPINPARAQARVEQGMLGGCLDRAHALSGGWRAIGMSNSSLS